MSIWFRPFTVDDVHRFQRGTMGEHLGLEIEEIGGDFLRGRLPVDHRTVQPHRILHGGASVMLAESLGSIGGSFTVDSGQSMVVGQEINANHLRPVREGHVHGTARPVHLGRRSQVWAIEIVDDAGKLICISRLTLAVIDRR